MPAVWGDVSPNSNHWAGDRRFICGCDLASRNADVQRPRCRRVPPQPCRASRGHQGGVHRRMRRRNAGRLSVLSGRRAERRPVVECRPEMPEQVDSPEMRAVQRRLGWLPATLNVVAAQMNGVAPLFRDDLPASVRAGVRAGSLAAGATRRRPRPAESDALRECQNGAAERTRMQCPYARNRPFPQQWLAWGGMLLRGTDDKGVDVLVVTDRVIHE